MVKRVGIVLVASALLVAGCGGGDRPPSSAPGPDMSAAPAEPAPAAAPTPAPTTDPDAAVIDVAVATLWIEPDTARPLDAPSLANPVDVKGWVAAMSVPDKLWLVGKLATQVLYGEPVTVVETSGAWTKVVVPSQPSSLDPRGYPGWLPTVQLARRALPASAATARVTAATAPLRDATDPARRVLLEVSYNTRLPVVSPAGQGNSWVTVATPSGGRAVLAASDVEILTGKPRTPTGADLVRTAQRFSGLAYLWAGTAAAAGFDCSGFTSTVYAAHGITIPRDADDQAGAGVAVDRSQLQPGDLLFFATNGGRGSIHHVSMYVGDGLMIQAPSTGRTVETVSVDIPGLAREYWGARRYIGG
jgi:cell wall-associated NlpC family hydrolase